MNCLEILERIEATRARCMELAKAADVQVNFERATNGASRDALALALVRRFGTAGAVETLLGKLAARTEVLLVLAGPWHVGGDVYERGSHDLRGFSDEWLRRVSVELALAAEMDSTVHLHGKMRRLDPGGFLFVRRPSVATDRPQHGVQPADEAAGQNAVDAMSSYDEDDDALQDVVDEELQTSVHDSGDVLPGAVDPMWRGVPLILVPAEGPLPYGFRSVVRPLLAHQERSLAHMSAWWASASAAGVLCLPTGAGKTRTAVSFVLRHALANGPVLWLTHRIELLDQALAAFIETAHELPRAMTVGRFAEGLKKVRQPVDVVVASIPTLARQSRAGLSHARQLLKTQGSFGLVVIDECHHGAAKSWRNLIEELRRAVPKVRTLGLSATPTRGSDPERAVLWKLLGEMVHEEPALDLINQGVLARPTLHPVATSARYDVTDAERRHFERFNDFSSSLLERISEDEARNALIVRSYEQSAAQWGQTLVFAANVRHGQLLTQLLRERGVRVSDVYSDTPAYERNRIVEGFRSGEINVVVNVGLFTEGTDIPGVDTLFLARPTNSRVLFQQMVGRGMRGPEVGGSALCQIVAFHDNVVGLIHQKLSSTFTDEREAILALGLDTPADAHASDESDDDELDEPPEDATREPRPSLAEEVARLRALLEWIRRADVQDLPLCGWWLAEHGRRKAFLPVFEGEEESTTQLVASIRDESFNVALTSYTAWGEAGEAVLTSFGRVACRDGAQVRYVEARWCSPSDIDELYEGVRAQVTRTAFDPLPQWWEVVETPGAAEQDETVYFMMDDELMAVNVATAAAVESVWASKRRLLAGLPDSTTHGLWAMATARLAASMGANQQDARTLLVAAAKSGQLPLRRVASTLAPDPASVLAVLRSVPCPAWSDVLGAAAKAIDPDIAVLGDEFLLDVLYEALASPPLDIPALPANDTARAASSS
jgi:superfamily II DNA or RNA helicase